MEEIKKERRQFPRMTVELIVRYKILSAQERSDAKTKNISGGGVCLVSREKMQAGTFVALEIKFPKSKGPILAGGRVVWSCESSLGLSPAGHRRFDNGVEFVQIEDVDRQRIAEHIKSELEKAKREGWKIGLVTDISK